MSLRSKIIIALFAVVSLFVLIDAAVRRLTVSQAFIDLERREAERDLDRARGSLMGAIEAQDETCATLVAWLEGRSPIREGDGETVIEEPADLGATPVDLIFLCTPGGRVLWNRILDPAERTPVELRDFPREALAPFHPLLSEGEGDAHESGFLMTERGPLLFSARDVGGPVPARLILGRFLHDRWARSLGRRVSVDFDAWPLEPDELPDHERALLDEITTADGRYVDDGDPDLVRVYTVLPDHRGMPALLLGVRTPRTITAEGLRGVSLSTLSALTTALLVLVALGLLLRRIVTSPLAELTRHAVVIGESDDTTLRTGMERGDEIGVLSQEFDRMVERLDTSRRETVETARVAGMAEVAIGVIHNVGNVVNSVNVAADQARTKVEEFAVGDLEAVLQALDEHRGGLDEYLSEDPQGRHLVPFLRGLIKEFASGKRAVLAEIADLVEGVNHVKQLVASQRDRAVRTGLRWPMSLGEELDTMVAVYRRLGDGLEGVEVVRDFEELPRMLVDTHRLREILETLLQNAVQALAASPESDKRLVLRLSRTADDCACIEVEDNGVGIRTEDLTRIFQLGFSTKPDGLGYGLHFAATAAMEMGARLEARSGGLGTGATFVLQLPIRTGREQVAA